MNGPLNGRVVLNDAAASVMDSSACEEIDTRSAESAVGDVRRDHFVAVPGKDRGHRSSATARLPDGATEAYVLQQRLGYPVGRGVEVPAPPIKIGNMDGTKTGRWTLRRGCCWTTDASQRQSVLMRPDCHQVIRHRPTSPLSVPSLAGTRSSCWP